MIVSSYLILVAICINANEASKILAVIPTPSISHQVPFRPLFLELVKRGHEVTVITTDPMFKKGEGPANLTEIDVHDVSYQKYKEFVKHDEITKGTSNDLDGQLTALFLMLRKSFEKQMMTSEVQKLLKSGTKFDLLFLEAFIIPALSITHVFKNVPVIQISSVGTVLPNLDTIGAPKHPFLYPTCMQQKAYKLSFWDKISELQNYYRTERLMQEFGDSSKEMCKQLFGDDFPDFTELANNVDMLFLNVHSVWEFNRPVPPNVIYMGGIHQTPEKELPQDLKKYLDSSKHGVIYVSFGTNVDPGLLPPEKIKPMTAALSKLNYDVLWKWNQDVLPGQAKNIRISKWLPQSDLLKHPKVKLFITQGGLQSTDEALNAGVPLIGIPMLGDQWFNVEHYVHHKIGLRVDMDTITEEKLGDAIKTILKDRSYRDNVLRLRTLMHDQPQSPLERAVWWTEYVIRHKGAKHLRAPAANMPWTEYYEIEFVSILLTAFLSVVTVVYLTVYYLFIALRKRFACTKLKTS